MTHHGREESPPPIVRPKPAQDRDPFVAIDIITVMVKNMTEVCKSLKDKFPELDDGQPPMDAAVLSANRRRPVVFQAVKS